MAGLTGAVGIVNIVMVECCVMMPGLLGHTLGRQLSTLSAGKQQAVITGVAVAYSSILFSSDRERFEFESVVTKLARYPFLGRVTLCQGHCIVCTERNAY